MALAIQGARLDGGQLCSPNMTSWPRRAPRPRSEVRAWRRPGSRSRWRSSRAAAAPAARRPRRARARARARGEGAFQRRGGARPRDRRAARPGAPRRGLVGARVRGGEAKIEPKEKLVAISIPSARTPMSSASFTTRCSTRARVIRNFIELLDPAKVEVARVVPWEVSVHRESPAVFVQALYLVPTAGGKAAGLLKIALHADRARPIACLHDEVGMSARSSGLAKALFDRSSRRAPRSSPSTRTPSSCASTSSLSASRRAICSRTRAASGDGSPARPPSCRVTPNALHIEDGRRRTCSSILRADQGRRLDRDVGSKANHRIELSQKKTSSTSTRERSRQEGPRDVHAGGQGVARLARLHRLGARPAPQEERLLRPEAAGVHAQRRSDEARRRPVPPRRLGRRHGL